MDSRTFWFLFWSALITELLLITTLNQGYHFSSGHIWMWELDYKESWAPKKWCFRTVVLEKILESPLDCKEIQLVHPKGDQSWVFIGRTDAEAETPIIWPLHAKSWLIGKDPDAGRDWGQEEKGITEDEMAASLTRWTWVWVSSGSLWWTGRPDILWFMGSQRVGHDWVTELNWTEEISEVICFLHLLEIFLPQTSHDKKATDLEVNCPFFFSFSLQYVESAI